MCAVRQTMSTRATVLAAKASPYHSTVPTLYDFDSEVPGSGPSKPQRATRRIKEVRALTEQDDEFEVDDSTRGAKKPKCVPPEADATASGDHDVSPQKARPDSGPTRKSKRKSKSNVVAPALDIPHATPSNWAEVYTAIKAMRAQVVAPVDTMGCQQAQVGEQDPKNKRFVTLIALMLSSQTKDEVMHAAVCKLRAALGGAVSIQAILDADKAIISEAIAKVGFWRKKTQYIKQAAQKLQDDFEADVPKTIEGLCSLPGVGPKMAFLTLQLAWNLNMGICVDVHVHRITNRLGWHVQPTKNPEETRINLESWLPKELHGDINHLLVGFGQTVCLPVGPKCGECTLSDAGLCPSAQTSKNTKASKSPVKVRFGPKIGIGVEPEV